MTAKIARRALDVFLICLALIGAGYVAHAGIAPLLNPALATALLSPQHRSCVIRDDVCRVVARLEEMQVRAIQLAPELTPEAYHRIAEFAFPIRLDRAAPTRVGPCNRRRAGESIRLQVRDSKRSGDTNADICIFAAP